MEGVHFVCYDFLHVPLFRAFLRGSPRFFVFALATCFFIIIHMPTFVGVKHRKNKIFWFCKGWTAEMVRLRYALSRAFGWAGEKSGRRSKDERVVYAARMCPRKG
jgi:hypothetical protein